MPNIMERLALGLHLRNLQSYLIREVLIYGFLPQSATFRSLAIYIHDIRLPSPVLKQRMGSRARFSMVLARSLDIFAKTMLKLVFLLSKINFLSKLHKKEALALSCLNLMDYLDLASRKSMLVRQSQSGTIWLIKVL